MLLKWVVTSSYLASSKFVIFSINTIPSARSFNLSNSLTYCFIAFLDYLSHHLSKIDRNSFNLSFERAFKHHLLRFKSNLPSYKHMLIYL